VVVDGDGEGDDCGSVFVVSGDVAIII